MSVERVPSPHGRQGVQPFGSGIARGRLVTQKSAMTSVVSAWRAEQLA